MRSKSKAATNRINRPANDDIFKSTKKDKRRIKHSALINRIEKSNSKVKKRRRPSKKLITNLQSLAEALPETVARETPAATTTKEIRTHRKSPKTKPGATKQRETMEKLERERFSKNLAQMALISGAPSHNPPHDMQHSNGDENKCQSSDRWAALRGFIRSAGQG